MKVAPKSSSFSYLGLVLLLLVQILPRFVPVILLARSSLSLHARKCFRVCLCVRFLTKESFPKTDLLSINK